MIWLLGGYIWLYVHRPFEFIPTLGALQFERAYMLVMILAWLVTPNKGLASNRIHVALAGFSLALIAAWVLSPYAARPGTLDVIDTYAKVAVFYVLVITTVRDERSLRLLVFLFLTAVGLYTLHSLREFIGGRYQWRMGTRRMTGVDITFGDPNAFASTLLYTLPMVLPFWNERPRRFPLWFLLGYVFMLIGCILLTGSRAGFAGLCILGFILFVFSARSKLQALAVASIGGVVALLLLSVVLSDDLANRYLTLVDSSRGPQNAQVSASGRLDGFLWGIHVWQQSPVVGYGPGSFAYSTGRGGQAHNVYGQVLSEMGTMGALAWLSILVCFYLNWREGRRFALAGHFDPQHDFAYQVSRAISIVVVLLLIMGWAGHNLYRYNWQWFAAFSGIAIYCLRSRSSQAIDPSWQSIPHPGYQFQGQV